MSTATAPATAPAPVDWEAARAQRRQELLAAFNPVVAGMPGDGEGVVLHTDNERNLTYTWFNVSRRPQDFQSLSGGHIVSRLSVTYRTPCGDDLEVAYLNITHTTREHLDSLPSIFHWAEENTGMCLGLRFADEDNQTVPDQKIWAGAYNHLNMRPESMRDQRGWAVSPSDAPTDPQVLAREIEVVAKIFRKQQQGFLRCLSVPFVDYSHVDAERDGAYRHDSHPEHPGNLRGTGIGRQMYLLAAQHLAATMGRVLRGSGLQSSEAGRLWERLIADPSVPTRQMSQKWYTGDGAVRRYWCIDYTPNTGGDAQ